MEPEIENQPARRMVSLWTKRIQAAKKKWANDFTRMRENMDFVAGYQWQGQDRMRSDKYTCNMTIQMVNHKVATLYAKNPSVSAKQRKRLIYQVWDENLETLANAVFRAQSAFSSGIPDVESEAIIEDYQQGRLYKDTLDKVARTLEYGYQHQIDSQTPEFKEQMKQLVTTAIICGVGYVRLCFHRQGEPDTPQAPPGRSLMERANAAQDILRRIQEGELDEEAPEVEQLRLLLSNMGYAAGSELDEGLRFEFPDPTTIIPDTRIRTLQEFLGARWVVQEYVLPLSEVNAFFGTEIKPTAELVTYTNEGVEYPADSSGNDEDGQKEPCVCLWEVMNFTDRTHCFVVNGHKDYVMPPEPMTPQVRRFWTIFGLTFNRVVVDGSGKLKATVFPPSDVDLGFHAQKEWNRNREGLRMQRRANAPKYMARKGLLTSNDKAALNSAEANEVVELEGLPADAEPAKFLAPMQHAPIDPLAYNVAELREDFMLATRMQEANMGPAQPDVTATVGTIAEQSRQTVAGSNVDDLDGLLSRLAEAGGEAMLREMSVQTIKRIVGPGAVWPEQNREDFVNEIYLQVEAASSGRPNKALESAQFERLAPLLLQAGANPVFLVREAVKRLDDRLDVNEAFPLQLPAAQAPGAEQGTEEPSEPSQPLQSLPSEAPVPLAGHM